MDSLTQTRSHLRGWRAESRGSGVTARAAPAALDLTSGSVVEDWLGTFGRRIFQLADRAGYRAIVRFFSNSSGIIWFGAVRNSIVVGTDLANRRVLETFGT